MTFCDAENLFFDQLADIYPHQEIEAIMHITFGYLFGFSRFSLHVNSKNNIPEKSIAQIYNIIHQLKQHKPIQYVLGETEFYGMPFKVDESVLIPRPETEELVKWVISDNKMSHDCNILDIGTGSGCIAVSLAKHIVNSNVYAVDVSESAINTAQINANLNSVAIQFSVCDILQSSCQFPGNFDVIISNPPYVTSGQKYQMTKNVLEFEPHIALFAPDTNPFAFYEAITSFAARKLKQDGFLYFEINEQLSDETAVRIAKFGFKTEIRQDINSKFRMIKAWKNG